MNTLREVLNISWIESTRIGTSDVIRFKNFAKENSWMCKDVNNSYLENNIAFTFNNKKIYGLVSVKIEGDFPKYPFVDTMCFLSKNNRSLSNLPDKDGFVLHDVYGDCDKCDSCKGDIIIYPYSDPELCAECSIGHNKLMDMGIETKWNSKLKKKLNK